MNGAVSCPVQREFEENRAQQGSLRTWVFELSHEFVWIDYTAVDISLDACGWRVTTSRVKTDH